MRLLKKYIRLRALEGTSIVNRIVQALETRGYQVLHEHITREVALNILNLKIWNLSSLLREFVLLLIIRTKMTKWGYRKDNFRIYDLHDPYIAINRFWENLSAEELPLCMQAKIGSMYMFYCIGHNQVTIEHGQ